MDIKAFMSLAVEEGKKSQTEERGDHAPLVGAVLVKDGLVLGKTYRGIMGAGNHAEFCLLGKMLKNLDVTGSTLFTTLEPCSRRGVGKTPCADWIVQRGISEVYIGMYDPNPKIYREGWRILRDAGIKVKDFHSEFRNEIRSDNYKFLNQYRFSLLDRSTVTFDYTQNGGKFTIGSGRAEIITEWGHRGKKTIYAVDHRHNVAKPRYANEISEVDDPSAFDFLDHAVDVNEGQVVIFRNGQDTYCVIKIRSIFSGPDRGDDRFEVVADYEIRQVKV
jgi:pyrimidine deaminase RibD-like protein